MHEPTRRHMRAALTTAIAGSLLLGTAGPAAAEEPTSDSAAPAITSIGLTDGQLAPAVLNFYPTVTDDIGVVKLEAFINGDANPTKCAITTVTRPFCRVLLGQLPSDTDATITLRAEDAAGNRTEATTRVHVDNVAPAPAITPTPRSSVRTGTVTIALQDVPADVEEIQVVDGQTGGLEARITTAPWTYTWQAASGKPSPDFIVWDKAGNLSSLYTDYVVDDTGPAVTVTPSNRALVRGTRFTTTVTASDPAGISRSYLAGADGAGLPSSYTTTSVEAGKDGTRTVTWIVLDKLGNRTSASRTVIVDNTGPTVAFSKAPKNGAKLTKTTAITAAASDHNGIARVQLLVNGKQVANDTRAAYAFTLNPKGYGKTFTVKLRAYDRAGNIRYTSTRTYHH